MLVALHGNHPMVREMKRVALIKSVYIKFPL